MARPVLLRNVKELMTLKKAVACQARGLTTEASLSILKNACMVVDKGQIVWIGKLNKLPKELRQLNLKEHSVDANIFPGFIDSHTHSVFLGDRTREFELRNQGVSYQEIAKKGGGILSTVHATRKGTAKKLSEKLSQNLNTFRQQGVTTVEVKSGYGLNLKEELKVLNAIKQTKHPINIVSTFLGAHAKSPEFSSAKEYLESLRQGLSEIMEKQLAERVDIFVEKGYFSTKEARQYLTYAKGLGLGITIHADQLSRSGATSLCVELEASSADHAIQVNSKDIKLLAKSEVTCVLLPAADFYIHCPYPPAREMIKAGVRVALASDFNPGTAPTQNVQFIGLLARLKMKMTLPEVFVAYTLGGAYVLGMQEIRGALLPGFQADFFISEYDWDQYFYDLKPMLPTSVYIKGQLTKDA